MIEILTTVAQEERYDLLVVLGKNIGVDSTPNLIRERYRTYGTLGALSPESCMNVMAAGLLWTPDTDILFSSGQTAGPDVPAEAAAQKALFVELFPGVPEGHLRTEEVSLDTGGNARETAKRLDAQARRYRHIGLVSIGRTGHARNATWLFRNRGVPVAATHAAEAVLAQHSPEHADYVREWARTKRVAQERRKERVRSVLIHTIDPNGELLSLVTQRTRR